jgi:hypothetical protein
MRYKLVLGARRLQGLGPVVDRYAAKIGARGASGGRGLVVLEEACRCMYALHMEHVSLSEG